MNTTHPSALKRALGFSLLLALTFQTASLQAGPREQAKRIHDRLLGTPPTSACLDQLENEIANGDGVSAALDAMEDDGAGDACTDPSFYNVTLKNFVTPWTNEAQTMFDSLNDYTATVIGLIRDEDDFRKVLYDDVLYIGDASLGLPAYSPGNNNHYETMEQRNVDLRKYLVRTTQSTLQGIPSEATAGIMTSRAAAKAFFVDGTNRAMFRFTMLNHLCTDLEQIKDPTRAHDRIRQDVSRSPGGDSRIYMNACSGCHAGMDPLAQAYAYYNYEYDRDTDPEANNGRLVYTEGEVQPKYLINADNFKWGYVTRDDRWDNYWREGPNSFLGWSAQGGSGNGAKSLGQELANSTAFARCQVQKVFKNVCLREPVNAGDEAAFETMVSDFQSDFNLKRVFANAASHCMGD